MTRNNTNTTESAQLAMDRKRLVLMQWGVVVALIAAVTAAVVPFATQAAADDAAQAAAWDAKHAETQERITMLLTKTSALETTQRHIQADLEEVKSNVKAIEADVQDIRAKVAENSATLESILTLLTNRLPERTR